MTHRKTGRLARALGISKVTAIGHLHAFWWWSMDNVANGDLTGVDVEDIADGAAWEGSPQEFLDGLIFAGFIDASFEGRPCIHHWMEYRHRTDDEVRATMRRAWERQRTFVRRGIFERDSYRCQLCGAGRLLEIDHILPIARGGTNNPANLQVLCRPCNRSKGVN